mmetsp:Transcript_21936/g.52133  ORF Transcript_21936/g.52133 Transcript_21936/m.52133 type:complete len:326 (-) Transcript_21936:90-1067(-)
MDDVANVRLVDAHPKRDGCDDDVNLVVAPPLLVQPAGGVVEPRVVRRSIDPLLLELLGEVVAAELREAVDDPRLLLLVLDEGDDVLDRLLLLLLPHLVMQVCPIEALDEHVARRNLEDVADVGAHFGRRGRCERHDRHVGKNILDAAEAFVVRAEVVPPLAHTVRLVNDDALEASVELALMHHAPECRASRKLLRRDVHEAQLRILLPLHLPKNLGCLVRWSAPCDALCLDIADKQVVDLVLHERDERRDDDGDLLFAHASHDRWKLVAQRLATSGRHEHKDVIIGERGDYDLLLVLPEAPVPEDLIVETNQLRFLFGVFALVDL